MTEKIFETKLGAIHYFADIKNKNHITLVFLPGLTADHRLFNKQIEYFSDKYNVFTWDAPAHNLSRPFKKDFSLADKAEWLKMILEKEEITKPVIIGQSMGGYVGQAFSEKYPEFLKGFVSIDSAPLQLKYTSKSDLWFMKHSEGMYRWYPWKALVRDGSKGCAESEYGIELMAQMMKSYDHKEYASLTGFGYKILAEAIEKNLSYEIKCPAILICGKQDKAGYTRKYNQQWHEGSGIPVFWIDDAGHNSNSDKPEEINKIIEAFICGIEG